MDIKNDQRISKSLYTKYKGAMAYIEVELPNGDLTIGSAFHIGEGVFITAKHVVCGNKIKAMGRTESYDVPDENGNTTFAENPQKYRSVFAKELTVKSGPHLHPDESIDVAAIVVKETDITIVPIGSHLDDWIDDSQFIMQEIIIMGYPPIPFSKGPVLVTARGEINAVLDKRVGGHPHFLVSTHVARRL